MKNWEKLMGKGCDDTKGQREPLRWHPGRAVKVGGTELGS